MPTGTPLLGEVWTTNASVADAPQGNRSIRGVVADVVSNVVTLVSFTGNRLRVAPDRFLATWQYVSPPPRTRHTCSTAGCQRSAVFGVNYDQEPIPEFVCPRHMPVGVQATLLEDEGPYDELLRHLVDSPGEFPSTRVVPQCPLCERDHLVEVVSAMRVTGGGRFFHCEGCNSRMVYADLTNIDLHRYSQNLIQSLDRENTPVTEIHISFRLNAELLRASRETPVSGSLAIFLYGIPCQGSSTVPGNGAFFVTRNSSLRAVQREPAPNYLTPPQVSSAWVNRANGSVVNVERVTSAAVHFRPSGTDSNVVMTLPDFHQYHRLLEVKPREKPVLPGVHPGEEWEVVSGVYSDVVRVIELNDRLQTVVVEGADGTRRSLRLAEMNDGRWRKVTRTSTYDRLINNTDDFGD